MCISRIKQKSNEVRVHLIELDVFPAPSALFLICRSFYQPHTMPDLFDKPRQSSSLCK